MKLKEKFKEILKNAKIHFINLDSQDCEQTADDYAIEFAEWCMLNYNFINKEHYTILLKEFKKQKGL
jgi:hypothetical protein